VAKEKVPPTDRIASSFQQLALHSSELNQSAQQLSTAVSSFETLLRRIGVSVPAWHCIAGQEEGPSYWTRDIGYSQFGDDWKVALRRTSGQYDDPESHFEKIWLFALAPKWMAVEAAGKLPDLVDELIKRTIETNAKMKARTTETIELESAIAQLYDKPVAATKSEKR